MATPRLSTGSTSRDTRQWSKELSAMLAGGRIRLSKRVMRKIIRPFKVGAENGRQDGPSYGNLEPASSDAQRAMVCTSRVTRAPSHHQSLVSKTGKETVSVPSLTSFRNA